MKGKQKQLIEYLLSKNSSVSSEELATFLNVSKRTIINYVNNINGYLDNKIIFSSNQLFWINKEKARLIIDKENKLPQDYNSRATYLIKLLLTRKANINIYSICEELFVSYSTIKSDISKINEEYKHSTIRIIIKNNNLVITGDEKDKRKLMSKLLYNQNNNNITIENLKESLPTVDVTKLSLILTNIMKKYHYYINDFSLINIVMHYAISIERIQNGYSLISSNTTNSKTNNATETAITEELSEELLKNFNLQLSNDELVEFLMLIRTNAQKTEKNVLQITNETVDEKIANYTTDLVKRILDIYYIDLNDDQFIIPFIIHLKYLIKRMETGSYINNPLINTIQDSSPILFDLAIFIANDISCHFKIQNDITIDEIGFIAIHLGAQIDRQNKDFSKINVLIVCPDYIKIASSIRNKLLYNFGSKINIVANIANIDNIDLYDYDAIISTVSLNNYKITDFCTISPFVSDSDIVKILELINRINEKSNLQILKDNFDYYFSKENFIFVDSKINKFQAIDCMCKKLVNNRVVRNNFVNDVFSREEMCSTEMGYFALPHSFKMNALKSKICVLISKDGIIWNKFKPNLVMLIAISKKDINSFYKLYEALITLLNMNQMKDILINCKDYNDFKNRLLSLL